MCALVFVAFLLSLFCSFRLTNDELCHLVTAKANLIAHELTEQYVTDGAGPTKTIIFSNSNQVSSHDTHRALLDPVWLECRSCSLPFMPCN